MGVKLCVFEMSCYSEHDVRLCFIRVIYFLQTFILRLIEMFLILTAPQALFMFEVSEICCGMFSATLGADSKMLWY